LVTSARRQTDRFMSVREANRLLVENRDINKDIYYQIERLRTFRNTLVHTPKKISTGQIQDYLVMVEEINRQLRQ